MKSEVKEFESVIAAAIRRNAVHMDSLTSVLGEIHPKLMKYLTEQGRQVTGVPYLAYMNGSEDFTQFDIEWGIPVDEAVPETDEFYMSKTYGGKAATTTYKGPYKEIVGAYNALMEYAQENKLEMTGVYYDYYLNDPEKVPESELLTQILYPLK